MGFIHRGMRAVVQVGTTHEAFKKAPPAIRCHTYAKTGTAQIGRRDNPNRLEKFNSAWLIGWHQPPNSDTRLAFACMVTHSKGTGGKICGPIVSDLLRRINTTRASAP